MKVPLQPEKKNLSNKALIQWRIIKCLPFFLNASGMFYHRIRRGKVYYRSGDFSHAAFTYWCGNVGTISKHRPLNNVLAKPPARMNRCRRCEEMAIRAGLPTEQELINA